MSDFSPGIDDCFLELERMELLHIQRNPLEVVIVHPVQHYILLKLELSILGYFLLTVSQVFLSLVMKDQS